MMSSEDIHKRGLTKQRAAVLQVIRASGEHLTASGVFDHARQLLPGISYATVYNSLHFLKDAGHIAEISFGSGASRFDPVTSRHDHAICTRCGMLVDIEMEHPRELAAQAAALSNFEPESLEFTLRGICPDCIGK